MHLIEVQSWLLKDDVRDGLPRRFVRSATAQSLRDGREQDAVQAIVSSDSPGHEQEKGQDHHDGVDACTPCRKVQQVQTPARERRQPGEQAQYQQNTNGQLAHRNHPGKPCIGMMGHHNLCSLASNSFAMTPLFLLLGTENQASNEKNL